jgi:hypothetical protein
MSVALTVPQVRDRSKTVTRRDGWLMLKPGDPLTLCEKVRGRKKGEPLVRIADVQVVSVRREPLNAITPQDVAAEGFPGWTTEKFVSFFAGTHQGCEPGTVITRIEWRYAPAGQCAGGLAGREGGGMSGQVRPAGLNPVSQAQALGAALTRLGFTAEVLSRGGHRQHPCVVVGSGPGRIARAAGYVYAGPDDAGQWWFWVSCSRQDPAGLEPVAPVGDVSVTAGHIARTLTSAVIHGLRASWQGAGA